MFKKVVLLSFLIFGYSAAIAGKREILISENSLRKEIIHKIINAFKKEHPKISVKLVSGDSGTSTPTDISNLLSSITSGQSPDVYRLDRFTVAERASNGLLYDLTPLIGKNKKSFASKYLHSAWSEVVHNRKIYALPLNTDVRLLFYRKDILKDEDIDLSVFNEKEPISIAEFKKIANKLNMKNDDEYERIGFLPWANGFQMTPFTWATMFNATLYNEEKCLVELTNPKMIEAFEYLKKWATEIGYKSGNRFLKKNMNHYQDISEFPFVTGKVPLMINGIWAIPLFKKELTAEKWGVTWMPNVDKKKTSWSGGWSLVIPATSKNPKDAFTFIKFAAGLKGQRIFAEHGTHDVPTIKSLISDKSLIPQEYKFAMKVLKKSRARAAFPMAAVSWDMQKTAMSRILENNESVIKVFNEIQRKLHKKMRRYCKKKKGGK